MPSATTQSGYAPTLETFLVYIKDAPLESSVERLISLLKRRQIKHPHDCAEATGRLLKVLVGRYKWSDANHLMEYIQSVGRRLSDAQPREMVVANVVRRVLGMIRDEVEEDRDDDSPENSRPDSSANSSPGTGTASPKLDESVGSIPALRRLQTSRPVVTTTPSLFHLLATGPDTPSHTPPRTGISTPPINASLLAKQLRKDKDNIELKAEIIAGMEEILDELSQVEDQIAGYGPDQIVEGEYLFTHAASITVQKFLLKAAQTRKFTVFHAETFPNENEAVYDTLVGLVKDKTAEESLDKEAFMKPLVSAGIEVIFCKDPSIFAVMSRVHKVIISPRTVFVNGGMVASAGARLIAKAAQAHKIPVIVLCGVYKLSPEYPFDIESLIEYGNPSKVLSYHEGRLLDRLEVENPMTDYVPPELVNLYITNIGPCAPSYLYRVIADHYKTEDINFNKPEMNF